MSKLARRLCNIGMYTLMLEPQGHGDSSGYLEDVSISSLYEDMRIGISYVRKQIGGKLFCVSRGLNATLLSPIAVKAEIDGLVGLSPFCVQSDEIKQVWGEINPGVIEIADFLTGTDYLGCIDFDLQKVAFFNALGTEAYNVQGLKLNLQLILDLLDLDYHTLSWEKSLWLVPGDGKWRLLLLRL